MIREVLCLQSSLLHKMKTENVMWYICVRRMADSIRKCWNGYCQKGGRDGDKEVNEGNM